VGQRTGSCDALEAGFANVRTPVDGLGEFQAVDPKAGYPQSGNFLFLVSDLLSDDRKPKNYIMKSSLTLLVVLLLLASCRGTRDMRVEVMRPARITVPKSIQSVALLNRSVPTHNDQLESVLTGERPAQDKDLSQECQRGLSETLATSARFKIARCENTMDAADGKSLGFGTPLSWEIVDSLCKHYGTDALMSLEYFDTDFSVVNPGATAAAAVTSVLNGGNGNVEATGKARASAGFRIYDPKTKTILYEDRFNYNRTWTRQATNPVDAVAGLIKKNEALFMVSYEAGSGFAMDVVPLYYWEDRELYKGRKGRMEIGERQALSKDWESALKTWTDVYENETKSKIRARAAFNAALACEVLGNLEQALDWAQKAYVEDGKDPAYRYSDLLDQRIREQAKLEEQLPE
jgi:hypothetical protein